MDSVDKAQAAYPLSLDDPAAEALRARKINELKKAIEEGSYHVSAEALAGKLMEHMLEPES